MGAQVCGLQSGPAFVIQVSDAAHHFSNSRICLLKVIEKFCVLSGLVA
jgi:hypothetical protein